MARLLLPLLLAALCWAGETAGVCDFTRKTGNITLCSQQAMDQTIDNLPARIQQIKIPSWKVPVWRIEYRITNIHFEGATNPMVKDASYGESKNKKAGGFSGFVGSKEITVNLKWPSITLVMDVSSTRLCLKVGPCGRVTAARATLRFNVATLAKKLPASIFKNKTSNNRYVSIHTYTRANVRLEIGANPVRNNIQVNSSPDSDKALAGSVWFPISEAWKQRKSNIIDQLRQKMDDWLAFHFQPTLAKKLKA